MKYFEHNELEQEMGDDKTRTTNLNKTFDKLESSFNGMERNFPLVIGCGILHKNIENVACTKEIQKTILDLPTLAMTKIFSYMYPPDLGRCAQVCWMWNKLVYQPCLWKRILPVQWAVGCWGHEDDWVPEQYKTTDPYQSVDLHKRFLSECKIISGLLCFVLCRVGTGVRELNLGASCVLNDMMFNVFLLQCPNIIHLDVSYTAVSFSEFWGLKENGCCRLLNTVCFAGCTNFRERAFLSLIKCWEPEEDESDDSLENEMDNILSTVKVPLTVMTECDLLRNLTEEYSRSQVPVSVEYIHCKKKARVSGLQTLILSGCSWLTDRCLEEMIKLNVCGEKLTLLDLSGCFRLSACMLNKFVKSCPNLTPEYLFYCEYICGGPYSTEANGCNNLQSPKRTCCILLE